MSVIPLTIFFSLLLAGLFIVLFAHDQRSRASAERDSLLPLADETPRLESVQPVRPSLGDDGTPGSAAEPAGDEDPFPESIYF